MARTTVDTGWGLWLQWLAATAIGWAAGEAVASFVPEDTILLGTIHTAVIGLVLGTMQWLILRRHIEMATRWILATLIGSAVGGGVGLAASFAAGATVIQPWGAAPIRRCARSVSMAGFAYTVSRLRLVDACLCARSALELRYRADRELQHRF